MRKMMLAAATLSTVLMSSAASAQPYEHRGESREWSRDRGHDRYDRPHRHQREGRYYSEPRVRYYGQSYGYDGYRGSWRTGQRYPYYNHPGYYIDDYRTYGLAPPRPGYRYYRDTNGDVVMAAIASGVIGLIIGGALSDNDHDRYHDRYDYRR